MPSQIHHRHHHGREERNSSLLHYLASEILLAASASMIILILLFILYDGTNNIHWPIPLKHVALGTIPNITIVLCWRHYMFYRLQSQAQEYQEEPTTPRNHQRHYTFFLLLQQILPWTYGISCAIVASAMFFLPIQFIFEDAQLNPKTGEPYPFGMLCAICHAFVGVLFGLTFISDSIFFMGRKILILLSNNNIIPHQTYHAIILRARSSADLIIPILFLLTAKIVLGGVLIALENPVVNVMKVPIPQLPMENFRIIQLSDLHIGVSVGKSRIEKTIQIANDLCNGEINNDEDNKCDLIAITGDLIDGDPYHLMKALQPLQNLGNSRIPKIFVTGNHEHLHYNVERVIKVLSEMGIDSLMNDNTRLPKGKLRKEQLVVVGLDDLSSKESRGKAQKAFHDTIPGKDTIILLAHQPNHLKIAEMYGSDLMLSGHTHAGQMFPFTIGAWIWNAKFSGYYPSEKTSVYVSAGTHWWGPPVRFTTRHHEIVDIRLTRD